MKFFSGFLFPWFHCGWHETISPSRSIFSRMYCKNFWKCLIQISFFTSSPTKVLYQRSKIRFYRVRGCTESKSSNLLEVLRQKDNYMCLKKFGLVIFTSWHTEQFLVHGKTCKWNNFHACFWCWLSIKSSRSTLHGLSPCKSSKTLTAK